jgi:hypothetical protein
VAGLGRKVFVAGEILQAAELQGYAVDQSVMVFNDSTARTAAIPTPAEGMVSYLKDTDQVQVYTTAWGPIGRVLQVVSTTKTDTFSASLGQGASTAITGLSATITPLATSSKIFVAVAVTVGDTVNANASHITLKRASTAIGVGDAAGARQQVSSGTSMRNAPAEIGTTSMSHLDSPNTTSATTYSVDISHSRGGTTTVYVNRSLNDTDSFLSGRAVSSITVWEVAA